ncbi:hypothetical protein MEQU1_002422 [Malassezia equina]|uniref:SH3 domain-containing protein n=1 Tax=Malassezia equina TaxID=1381935 RepID=A0AAF0EDV5_9BASI|nr:hypothetical protein MEQU1_002422 [Malassezia equina]
MSFNEEDRQAFFRLMDEYFASRPHILSGLHPASAGAAPPASIKPPPPPPRHASGGPASPAPPVDSVTSSMQQASVSERSSGPHIPEGLTRGKVCEMHSLQGIGKINTTSAQSVITSSAGLATSKVLDVAKHKIDYYTGKDRSDADSAAPTPPSGPIQPPPQRGTAPQNESEGLGEAVALYPFAGSQAGDLYVDQGETITLLEQVTPDWFRARSADGTRVGIVPANYIQRS